MEQPIPGQSAVSSPIDPTNVPESNLPLAILGGVAAALVGAALWAVITVTTGYQIGFMAIGVGFLVGYAVRLAGKGSTPVFGAVGALLSLAGCVVGNVLAIAGFIASDVGQPFFAVLSQIEMATVPSMLTETFSAIDVVFYAIAVYEGYKLSFVAPPAGA
jgi:hypothetical protein